MFQCAYVSPAPNVSVSANGLTGQVSVSDKSNYSLGQRALSRAANADTNLAFGFNAMYSTRSVSNNSVIGANAMSSNFGSVGFCTDNIAIGVDTLKNYRSLNVGNIVVGSGAGPDMRNASNNICIGTRATLPAYMKQNVISIGTDAGNIEGGILERLPNALILGSANRDIKGLLCAGINGNNSGEEPNTWYVQTMRTYRPIQGNGYLGNVFAVNFEEINIRG